MSYTSAKYGLSKRYTNRCVLHHCKFLMSNKSWKGMPYVHMYQWTQSRGFYQILCEETVLFYKRAISDTFSRATRVLAANNASVPKKTTKNNHIVEPKVFSPKHTSGREQQFQVIPVSPLSMIPGKLF